MPEKPFVRRLSDEEAHKVASGEMLAELQNGKILEKPLLWSDRDNSGRPVVSLMGSVGQNKYSWPACGCGVKLALRAIPKP